jgi:hypothetical protein
VSIATAPCDWPLVGCEDCSALAQLETIVLEYAEPDEGEGESEGSEPLPLRTMRDVVEEAATAYLWNWTGKAFGLCEVEVRPCRRDCEWSGWGTYRGWAGRPDPLLPSHGDAWPFAPALVGGSWRNVTCLGCGELCSCSTVEAITLPGPVDSIVEVVIDGETLDPSAYRVDDYRHLVRIDGEAWPTCQDLDAPLGDEGTWAVRYRWGAPVPSGGQLAAGNLACEMAKAACRDSSCGLPERITNQVTREGISVTILDAFEGLEAGRTGLWLVDSWVASIRKPAARSTVHVPGGRTRRVRTSTYWGSGL